MRFAVGFALFVAASFVGGTATYMAVTPLYSNVHVVLEDDAPIGNVLPSNALLEHGAETTAQHALTPPLPVPERPGSRIDAAESLAATDPQAALDLANTFVPTARRLALERIAAVAARRDPKAALALNASFADPMLRGHWETSVIAAWTRDDADGALAYIVGATPKDAGYGALPTDVLLAAAPGALLTAIDDLPFIANREALRARAFESLAELDPLAAFEHIAELHPVARDDALTAVGRALARRDGAAALAWVRGIEPRSVDAEAAVLAAIAESDFDAAVEIALTDPYFEELTPAALIEAATDGERLSRLANRLAATGGAHANWLPAVLRKWGRVDATAAFDWLVASGMPLSTALVQDAASSLALHDVETAARAVDRVPVAWRGEWITEVVRRYGRADPAAAAAWLARFERDSRYAEWRSALIESAAHADPRTALGLLTAHGATPALARTVAAAWAERDPAEAAEWALGQDAAATRASAFAGVANVWAHRDRDAFAEWLSRQPADSARDLGFAYLNDAALVRGAFDVDQLGALSSDDARAAEAARIAPRLARRDPEAALALVARYIDDAEKRRAVERSIDDALPP